MDRFKSRDVAERYDRRDRIDRMSGSRNAAGNAVPRGRFIAIGAIIALIFLGYIGYLFSMQIVDGYIYTNRAEQVTRRSVVVAAPRGNIYDRYVDTPIATNRESFAVDINPAEIDRGEIDQVFNRFNRATPPNG